MLRVVSLGRSVWLIAFAGWLSLGLRAIAAEDLAEARIRQDVMYLASDDCEGRGVATKGINLAAEYIAHEFKLAGLKPGGPGSSYFQAFTMTGPADLAAPNTLKLTGPLGQQIELTLNEHFRPIGMSSAGAARAPVVFLGYAAKGKTIPYDDFQGVDVAGKVVVVLRKTPRADHAEAAFDGKNSAAHAALKTKIVNADQKRAAAILFVNDRSSAQPDDALMDFRYTAEEASPGRPPAVQVRRSVVDAMLQSGAGRSLEDLEQAIDRELKPHSLPLKGWTADLVVNVKRTTLPVKNIVGVIEGGGPLAKETVVIGAHYDHLGFGGRSSLARDRKPAIHHGADDNASGTAALIELARRFGHAKAREGRRLVFLAFSGEESGLLGSAYYCKQPLFPLEETAAMINMDMVGRLRADANQKDKLIVHGVGTAKSFDRLVDEFNRKHLFKIQKVASGFGPSDHSSFYAKKIPVLFFFTGDHSDYHRPSDTADKINVHGINRVVAFVEEVAEYLAAQSVRPEYVEIAASNTAGREGSVPRLGIRPDYGDDRDGVLLGGVSPNGPAAKAGLKEGDRIVEVGGKSVKNLEAYMVLMGGRKKGESLELGISRDGKKLTVKVIPE